MSFALDYQELLQTLPPARRMPEARAHIRGMNEQAGDKLVVLDDDPTGCQTVHDVTVLTEWPDDLLSQVARENDCFYVLTNSRAFSQQQAVRINRDIVERLLRQVPRDRLKILSRSDSTLRGHFMAETRVLIDLLGPFDGLLVVPYFQAGGRLTANDTHYVLHDGTLIPAHETEFGRDPVFGFNSSHLPAYVEEKSEGLWKKEDTVCITLRDIREGGPDRVFEKLMTAENARPVILNALCDEDLEIAVVALCRAETAGKRFLYRTAASFVKIRAGIDDVPLCEPPARAGKGLVVVGSHVEKTTRQFHALLRRADIVGVEVTVRDILSDERGRAADEAVKAIDAALAQNRSAVLYTERQYALAGSDEQRLGAGEKISDFLCQIVASLTQTPDFVIAKGGITSCDVARKGLGVKEALVLGQILPGVPLWRLGPESKCPGLLYVVFPGNVGGDEALYEAYAKFAKP
ncbi:MAG: hypothetical protein JW741_02395 [Sedimentisphaerales bacterium]|nr:hypothetical protein [Sedimentisphaerales bacterium]